MARPNDNNSEKVKEKVEKLLQQVASGVLKPSKADEEAERLGFGRLSRELPMDEYHPLAKSRWTLTMVLAWITWRTYDEVREWDAQYLSRCRYWGSVSLGKDEAARGGRKGSRLYRRRPPTLKQFEAWGDRRFGPWISGSDGAPIVLQSCEAENALPALWKALLGEGLGAAAIKSGGGPRVLIPAQEWEDLEVHQELSGPDILVYRHEPNKCVYKDVTWSRADVLNCWAPHKFSDFPDQADLQWGPIIDDADKWNELYDWLEGAEILNASAQVKLASKSRREGTKKDLEELKKVQESRLQEGQPLLTYKGMQSWAQEKGIGREWVRAVRKKLPDCLKLERGQHSKLADK